MQYDEEVRPTEPVLDVPTSMSRKFNRRQKVEEAAFRTLQASLRQKPRFLPLFIWRPLLKVALKIAFR